MAVPDRGSSGDVPERLVNWNTIYENFNRWAEAKASTRWDGEMSRADESGSVCAGV